MVNKATLAILIVLALLGSASGQECQFTIPQCLNCSTTTTCAICATGFLPTTGGTNCIACNFANCIQCVQDNLCSICASGFSLGPNALSCISCNVANCVSCNAQDSCNNCLTGFTAHLGSCFSCGLERCVQCQQNNICATCENFYNPDASGQCVQCIVNGCSTC